MKRRIAISLMLTALVFIMISCNSKKDSIVNTKEPTQATNEQTDAPTDAPSDAPSDAPTDAPSDAPTDAPTEAPTEAPTQAPTETPTETPTDAPVQSVDLNVLEVKGYKEFIKLSFENTSNATYQVGYKKVGAVGYTYVNGADIVKSSTANTCEITALPVGSYEVCIKKTTSNGNATKTFNVLVTAIDRSGYAHFNNTDGIGAYNNDGSLKSNVIVLNLTNANKNTITATFSGKQYVGIANILMNLSKSQNPVLIRVHGKITTNQWNYKAVVPRLADNSNLSSTHFENTFSTEYGENIANITLRVKDAKEGKNYNYKTTATGIVKLADSGSSKKTTTYTASKYSDIKGKTVYDDDSNFNCISISGAKNVTIEGVGTDAEIFQWGMSFSDAYSIEVKNLTFTGYPEDALAFMANSLNDSYSKYWIHDNTFNPGKNNWDLTGEQDKSKGDGALDLNNVTNVTASYNNFNKCGKTGLVGSSDSASCKNITFHHNYYNEVSSRLPLGRGANIHIYNNYYYKCGSCLSIRANGYVFSESNYFENSSNAHKVTSGAVIKSFNDYFKSTSGVNSTKVTSRTQYVANSCKPDGKTDYSKFDVSSSLFYYDSVNKKTNVSILTEVANVPAFVKKYAGVNGRYQ